METRRVRAIGARTEFVARHGMVVMDEHSEREELRFPRFPVHAIAGLVEKGWAADDVDSSQGEEQPDEELDEAPASEGKPKRGRKASAPADDAPPAA